MFLSKTAPFLAVMQDSAQLSTVSKQLSWFSAELEQSQIHARKLQVPPLGATVWQSNINNMVPPCLCSGIWRGWRAKIGRCAAAAAVRRRAWCTLKRPGAVAIPAACCLEHAEEFPTRWFMASWLLPTSVDGDKY